MSQRADSIANIARAQASRHPVKYARQLERLPDQIEAARATGDVHELERLEALERGFTEALDEAVRCRRCGRELKNEVSKARKIGPECWKEEGDGDTR